MGERLEKGQGQGEEEIEARKGQGRENNSEKYCHSLRLLHPPQAMLCLENSIPFPDALFRVAKASLVSDSR